MKDIDAARLRGLELAVQLFAGSGRTTDRVIAAGGEFSAWLLARPASIRVGDPVITAPGDPAVRTIATRTGDDMAASMKDTDISADYPAPEALDSLGFQVVDAITITTDDPDGAVVTRTDGGDGSVSFAPVAPGAVQITWSDGIKSFADTLNVTPGDVASIVVGPPVITSPPSA